MNFHIALYDNSQHLKAMKNDNYNNYNNVLSILTGQTGVPNDDNL